MICLNLRNMLFWRANTVARRDISGVPTPGPWPTIRPWAIWNQAAEVAGECMGIPLPQAVGERMPTHSIYMSGGYTCLPLTQMELCACLPLAQNHHFPTSPQSRKGWEDIFHIFHLDDTSLKGGPIACSSFWSCGTARINLKKLIHK